MFYMYCSIELPVKAEHIYPRLSALSRSFSSVDPRRTNWNLSRKNTFLNERFSQRLALVIVANLSNTLEMLLLMKRDIKQLIPQWKLKGAVWNT